MSESNRSPDREPAFAVTVDSEAYAHVSADQRLRIEQDAISQIVALLPAEHRKAGAAELARDAPPEAMGLPPHSLVWRRFAGSSDPEIARLLGVIASVRAADDHDNAMRAASTQVVDTAASHQASSRVFVTVALHRSAAKSIAIVRPGYALPILLLRSDADASELKAGIETAAQLFRDFGPNVEKELRADVAVDANAGPAPAQTQRLLEMLRAGRCPNPGAGHLPALEVVNCNS